MKNVKVLVLVVVCLFAFSLVAGCSSPQPAATTEPQAATTEPQAAATETAAQEKSDTKPKADAKADTEGKKLIGFSAGYSMVQHWELEMAGCKAAADENGYEFIYQFADGNEQKQVADIETMVEMGISMLIVGPCNSEGIVPTIEEVKAKGIPVMTSDIGIGGTDVVAHVASDNYDIGVMAAEYIGDRLEGKGKIAVVGWAAASATQDREQGFVDTMQDKYPDIEIVAAQDVGGDRTKSLQACENILQSNKDLAAIFGCNAECALGAYGATQSLNRNDVIVVAVDSDAEVMDAIKAGSNLCATVAQNPYEMGYQAMTTAVKHLAGETVSDVAIPAVVVTEKNVQEIIDRDQKFLAESTLNK